MRLFNRNRKTAIENTKQTTHKILSEYVKGCLQSGKTIEWAKESLERNKEAGNYTSSNINDAINSIKDKEKVVDKPNFFNDNKDANVEKELKKLPKRERKKALELWEQYQAGKVLKPEKDKKLSMSSD